MINSLQISENHKIYVIWQSKTCLYTKFQDLIFKWPLGDPCCNFGPHLIVIGFINKYFQAVHE